MARSGRIRPESLKRVPGLFRRWELPDIVEMRRLYHIEEAGTHADGTPLLALYAGAALADDRRSAARRDPVARHSRCSNSPSKDGDI